MRVRSLLAVAALLGATVTAFPAIAAGNPPSVECPAGNFLAKYGDQLQFEEGTNLVQLSVTQTKNGGEVMGFSWTSSAPIQQLVVKAGKNSSVMSTGDATSGSFTVPTKHAISHVTFCRGTDAPDPDPEYVIAGNVDRICFDTDDATGGYQVLFSYNNVSTVDGAPTDVDRDQAGFSTSYPALAGQFPTTFTHTGGLGTSTEIEVLVTGWDGVSDLTFSAFGDIAIAKADPEGSMPSNYCA